MKNKWILNLLVCICTNCFSQIPKINKVTPVATELQQYKKFEISIDVKATYNNVYNYEAITVSVIFTSPTNNTDTVDAFWMEDFFNPDFTNHNLLPTGVPTFKIRYTPTEIGRYKYQVFVKDSVGKTNSEEYNFNCVASNGKGFIRKNNTNYLSYDDGKGFVETAQNLAYYESYLFADYTKWMNAMQANNQKIMRVWATSDAFGLEWKKGLSIGFATFDGLLHYTQKRAWALDWLMNNLEERDQYVMLTQLVHNEVLSGTNSPRWKDNPYNKINGGPCEKTIDFFTNSIAQKIFKNRLRYINARYGYSTKILAWELTNEINNTDGFYNGKKSYINQWQNIMSNYLKKIDVNKHLITTSFGGYGYVHHDSATWALPNIDITNYHDYDAIPNHEKKLKNITKKYLKDFAKPTFVGERGFAINEPNESNELDSTGIQLHNAIWGSMFSGNFTNCMEWQWGNFISKFNLNKHYKYLSSAANMFDLKQGNFKPVDASISKGNSVSNLTIQPNGQGFTFPLNDTLFVIDSMGNWISKNNRLGIIVMGNKANTQYRNPPTFSVNYPVAGSFTIQIGEVSVNTAKINIEVDGKMILATNASANKEYSVSIKVGKHQIKLDNLGQDWFVLKQLVFINTTNPLINYSLKSEDKTRVVGWILNQAYNYKWINENKKFPLVAENCILKIANMQAGSYKIIFKNTLTNKIIETKYSDVKTNQLNVALPAVGWDMVYSVEKVNSKK
jgi:Domain of unknown function (DUF5060)